MYLTPGNLANITINRAPRSIRQPTASTLRGGSGGPGQLNPKGVFKWMPNELEERDHPFNRYEQVVNFTLFNGVRDNLETFKNLHMTSLPELSSSHYRSI